MGLFDDGRKLLAGGAIGLGAIVLAPVVAGVVVSLGKPLLKAAIKGGILLAEKGKVAAAEAVETMEDLVAEAKAELVAAEEKAHGGKDPQAATDQPA